MGSITFRKNTIFLILANALGLGAFLVVYFQTLAIGSGDEGGDDPIGAFGFFFKFGSPIFLIFLAINVIWLVVLVRRWNCLDRASVIVWVLAVLVWLAFLVGTRAWAMVGLTSTQYFCEMLFGRPHHR